MKLINKFIVVLFLVFNQTLSKAETVYLDFKLILNQSDAGKKLIRY